MRKNTKRSELTRRITEIVSAILAQKELTLYDIKLSSSTGEDGVTLIDEISGGNMRVYKGDEYVNPLNIPGLLLTSKQPTQRNE